MSDKMQEHQDHSTSNAAESQEALHKPSLLALAWYFFWIALTTVQGAAGHMRRQIVQHRKLISEEEFLESFALAEFLPQPDSTFGLAVHVGHRVRGFPGALVVAAAMILPSFLLALVIGTAFIHFHKVSWVVAVAAGAGAAVSAIVGGTLLEIGKKAVSDYRDFLLILVAFFLLRYGVLHISGVILWITPLALWLHRPSRHEKLKNLEPPFGLVPTLGFRHHLHRKIDQILNSEPWGMVLLAAVVIGMMFCVFGAEKYGEPVFEKIHHSIVHESKTIKPQTCPALPFRHSHSPMDDFQIATGICTDLVSTFSALSVCAFGGEETILPCMQHASVSHHNWMDKGDFVNFFSLSYLIPGPSMLSSLVGLKACSELSPEWAVLGAFVAMLALFLPSIIVVLSAANSWDWLSEWKWRHSIGKALLLIAAGALSAAFMFITETAVGSPILALIAIVSALILLLSDLNPILIVLISGVAGLIFL
jgi:chromate transporter